MGEHVLSMAAFLAVCALVGAFVGMLVFKMGYAREVVRLRADLEAANRQIKDARVTALLMERQVNALRRQCEAKVRPEASPAPSAPSAPARKIVVRTQPPSRRDDGTMDTLIAAAAVAGGVGTVVSLADAAWDWMQD